MDIAGKYLLSPVCMLQCWHFITFMIKTSHSPTHSLTPITANQSRFYINTDTNNPPHSRVCRFTHSLTTSLTHPLIHSFILCRFTHSFLHSLTNSSTHSLIHPSIHPFTWIRHNNLTVISILISTLPMGMLYYWQSIPFTCIPFHSNTLICYITCVYVAVMTIYNIHG